MNAGLLTDAEIGEIFDAANVANPDKAGPMFYAWDQCPNLETDLCGEPWLRQFVRDFARRVERRVAERYTAIRCRCGEWNCPDCAAEGCHNPQCDRNADREER